LKNKCPKINCQFLVVASLARWFQGGTWFVQVHVLCIPCTAALYHVFALVLLLSLVVTLVAVCQADSFGLPGARM
jgi:hypothetical protein